MQRQRGELVPIGEALADLPGPVQALRDTLASRHNAHFTRCRSGESACRRPPKRSPDLGALWRELLALCSLPRSNPGNRKEYKRVNGPFTLYMNAIAW